jgi:hypothetical protein
MHGILDAAVSYRLGLSLCEAVSVFGIYGLAIAPTAAAGDETSDLILLFRIGKLERSEASVLQYPSRCVDNHINTLIFQSDTTKFCFI